MGKCVLTCQQGGQVCIDLSTEWQSVHWRVNWVGEHHSKTHANPSKHRALPYPLHWEGQSLWKSVGCEWNSHFSHFPVNEWVNFTYTFTESEVQLNGVKTGCEIHSTFHLMPLAFFPKSIWAGLRAIQAWKKIGPMAEWLSCCWDSWVLRSWVQFLVWANY